MTLTHAAFYSRKGIKYGFLFLLIVIFGRVAWTSGTAIYRKIFPPPPLPPQVAFGKLPTLPFPERPGLPTYSFTLQTTTGSLPVTDPTIPVYQMLQKTVTFLGLDEATSIAKNLGFNKTPYALTETIYRFEKEGSVAVLDVNTVNKTFSVSYNLESTPELLTLRPDSNQQALDAVHYFLDSADMYTKDIETGEKSYQYFKAQPPDLVETISLSEANFIRVNFFRNKVNGLPIMTPSRTKSNVWFLVSGDTGRDKQIIAGEYHYFPIDTSKSSTYPIKTPQSAYDELSAGRAFISQVPLGDQTQVVIRRVYLGYYDSGLPQGFLQPVFVFEGDNNFSAYVPAITDQYYGAPAPFSESVESQPKEVTNSPQPETTQPE